MKFIAPFPHELCRDFFNRLLRFCSYLYSWIQHFRLLAPYLAAFPLRFLSVRRRTLSKDNRKDKNWHHCGPMDVVHYGYWTLVRLICSK